MSTHMRSRRRFALLLAGARVMSFPGIAAAQDAPDIGQLAGFVRWGGVFVSIAVLIGAAIVLRGVSGIADRIASRFTSKRMLVQKVESFLRFGIYVAAATVCLGLSLRLDATAVTVIGGALAFAVGFAMRDLVAAFIAGLTIIFDRPFQVGDRVAYAGEYGDIIKIGLRSVQMSTLDHNIVTIPDNKVLTDVTSCGNYGAMEMQVAVDFYIGADQDVRLAMGLVREACLTSPYAILAQPVPVLARQVVHEHCVAFHIKARPYVLDTKYEKTFEADVHLRVNAAFREQCIFASCHPTQGGWSDGAARRAPRGYARSPLELTGAQPCPGVHPCGLLETSHVFGSWTIG